jgi:mannosyltransferase OCH1-like enzyme
MELPAIPEPCDSIPLVVHQTWKTEDVPPHWLKSHREWRTLPGVTYILWTDEMNRELVRQRYDWFLEAYDAYPYPIQRADAVRYFILHTYGGIYCDLDISPKKDMLRMFEYYRTKHLVIAKSASAHTYGGHSLTNAFMMSRPGLAFWSGFVFPRLKNPMQDAPTWVRMLNAFRHWRIINSTGPGMLNRAYKAYRVTGEEPLVPIPMEFVQPLQEWEARPGTTDDACVTLLSNGSWHKKDSTMFGRMSKTYSCYSDTILGSLLLVFLVLFVVFVSLYASLRARR